MNQRCPHCKKGIAAPPMSRNNESFHCPHCASTLSYRESDIVLCAAIFIIVATLALTLLCEVNSFVALPLSMVAYHLLRPSFLSLAFAYDALIRKNSGI